MTNGSNHWIVHRGLPLGYSVRTYNPLSLPIQNTRVWINGRQDVEEGEDEEDDFQPVPVDSWEISPDCIIMDTMLGEGQFGEVYKGLIKDGDINNPYFKGSECVAVKILRREFCCCCSPCITVCV